MDPAGASTACAFNVNHHSLHAMPYRHTENVVRHLAEREQAILAAATGIATENGMSAVQITAVAARAEIAAGTVYRYFPSKAALIGEMIAALAARELAAIRGAADAAPGPLSALAAAVATFAARALHARRLFWAVAGEPTEAEVNAARRDFRRLLVDELATRIAKAIDGGLLPAQDVRVTAAALLGALLEGLIGPSAPNAEGAAAQRAAVQSVMLLALRALGVADARARGLVAQCVLTAADLAY
jgi:AcrR family transcriptional regulator